MKEWLDEFYGSEAVRSSVLASLGPLFSSYAVGVWRAEGGTGDPPADFVASLAAAYTDHHLASSRIQLQEVLAETDEKGALNAIRLRLAEWAAKRPAKVAVNETVRTSNAVALEQMRSAGVTRKVWQSSGGSCPYCTSLNGKTVEITQDFFTPKDSFQPEGAESPLTFSSNVGHPPVHQGCDCSVVPG